MHAVLVKVQIKSGRYDEAIQSLQTNVLPQVTGAPGFVRGTWFGDHETGHGLVVFESEQQAQAMAGMVSAEADDPVEIQDVKVYEVHAEA
jgi:hypothetical protein